MCFPNIETPGSPSSTDGIKGPSMQELSPTHCSVLDAGGKPQRYEKWFPDRATRRPPALTRSQTWNHTGENKSENMISEVRRSRLTAGQRASTGLDADPRSSAETDSSRQNKTWKTKMTWHRAAADEDARMNWTGGEARRLEKARGMMEGAHCISHWRQKSKQVRERCWYVRGLFSSLDKDELSCFPPASTFHCK